MPYDQIYCSVDLEFTGFDPERDQILEIGFAFFTMTEHGAVVTEQWSQVFKPTIEVHPKILGLTGISLRELNEAPDFAEHREFLQEKLGNAIIVGHNPVMDVKFLEAYGVKLSGQVVDTLELVQFILPTHHSYNLENLVHYFGVRHDSANNTAHRALGDALSTIVVLENLVRVYSEFSTELKTELAPVIEKGNFFWADLVNIQLDSKDVQRNDSLQHLNSIEQLQPLTLSDKLITIDSLVDNHEARVALGLSNNFDQDPSVLVVPDAATVMQLWKNGLVHGVFRSEDTFSRAAFEKFLKTATTNEQYRFCLKILVWLYTNWQTEVVFDLNISFFGGQFRTFIVGGITNVSRENQKVLALDYATLQSLALSKTSESIISNKHLVICDVQNFERYISSGFQTRLSWSSTLYALRVIYNPETDFGNLQLKEEVLEALINTDLFFGLVFMLLHKAYPTKEYVPLDDLQTENPHIFSRLQNTAKTLSDKIKIIQDQSSSHELDRILTFLGGFFNEDGSRVKWVTVDERNLSLHDLPIDISESVAKIVGTAGTVSLTDTVTDSKLLSYLVDRLGLNTERTEIPNNILPSNLSIVNYPGKLSTEEVFNLVNIDALPVVIVFPTPSDVKEFYNAHYEEIKKFSAIFAQGYSGGGNKMFRNFSIKPNSVLLVTAEFMAKQSYLIAAKTIIFTGSPLVTTDHPYTAALLSHWENQHPDLVHLFSYAKVLAALKKIKLNQKVSVLL